MVGWHFDFQNLHVVVVGCFDKNLFECCGIGLGEGFASVLGSPDQVIFQPVDVMFCVFQLHALASLGVLRTPSYPSRGQAPAVSAALLKPLRSDKKRTGEGSRC